MLTQKGLSRDYQVACPSHDTYARACARAHARTTTAPIYSTMTPNLFPVLCSNVLNHHASMYLARSIASNQAYSQLLSRFRDKSRQLSKKLDYIKLKLFKVLRKVINIIFKLDLLVKMKIYLI